MWLVQFTNTCDHVTGTVHKYISSCMWLVQFTSTYHHVTGTVHKYISSCDWYSLQVFVVMWLEEFVIMWMLKTSIGGRTKSQALSFLWHKADLFYHLREGCFALTMLPEEYPPWKLCKWVSYTLLCDCTEFIVFVCGHVTSCTKDCRFVCHTQVSSIG